MSTSGMVAVDGAELAWSSDGEGRPVVCVHAGVADQRMWEPLTALLTDCLRMIRYDMRGFGRSRTSPGVSSPGRDLAALLTALDEGRAQLVGASFGGLVALEAAAIAPERVRDLVLLAPFVPSVEPSQEMRAFWEAEDAALEEGRIDDAVELSLRMWVDRSTGDSAIRALVADMQERAFRLQLETESDLEETPLQLERIDAPAIVAYGGADLTDFALMAEHLAAALPNARLERIDGAGHLLALERPEEVAHLILK
jgi:3-oxoadipate enol-lactonase